MKIGQREGKYGKRGKRKTSMLPHYLSYPPPPLPPPYNNSPLDIPIGFFPSCLTLHPAQPDNQPSCPAKL